MTNKFMYILAFLVLTVAMCQKPQPDPEPDPEPRPEPEIPCSVTFSPKINTFVTRAAENTFEDGDEISAYACYDESLASSNYAQNVRYSFSQGLFQSQSPIKYPEVDAALTFYAIYPFGNYSTPEMRFTVSNDQSTESAYSDSDLMTASAIAKGKKEVNLKFSHRLAKVVLDLAEVPSGEQSVTFCNLYTSVDADIAENTYIETGSRYNVRACPDGIDRFKVILPPQKIEAGTRFAEIAIGDKTFEWLADNDIYLSSGIEHKYVARIKENKLIFSAEINDWDKSSDEVDADEK